MHTIRGILVHPEQWTEDLRLDPIEMRGLLHVVSLRFVDEKGQRIPEIAFTWNRDGQPPSELTELRETDERGGFLLAAPRDVNTFTFQAPGRRVVHVEWKGVEREVVLALER